MTKYQAGDKIEFATAAGWQSGTVTRVWDKPNAPYVTVKTPAGQTFVRVIAETRPAR